MYAPGLACSNPIVCWNVTSHRYNPYCLWGCSRYLTYQGTDYLKAIQFCLLLSKTDFYSQVGKCVLDIAMYSSNISYCDYISYGLAHDPSVTGNDPVPPKNPTVINPGVSDIYDDDDSVCKDPNWLADPDHVGNISKKNKKRICEDFTGYEKDCYKKVSTFQDAVNQPCLGLLFALGWLVARRP